MKRMTIALASMIVLAFSAPGAVAKEKSPCSLSALSGNWMFATGVGRQMFGGPFPPDADVTAIGTMGINRDGTLSGRFDLTVEGFSFIPDILYDGFIEVNQDCTGTISFTTSAGSVRTDSVIVLSRTEIVGMTQDPTNLWTYKVRRLGG